MLLDLVTRSIFIQKIGSRREEKKKKHGCQAYQAHLVFKALPGIITRLLFTEEEWHLSLFTAAPSQ